jgi:hypothetical protein
MKTLRWEKIRIQLMLLILILCALPVFSQEEKVDIDALKKQAPKVYIDCGMCDIDYIRTEITFVNYVRDRKEAQIHVLITTQSTAGGGREYTLSFIGQHTFEGINDTHRYFTEKTDTRDEIREGLVEALKIGLMSYVAKTPIACRIQVDCAPQEKPAVERDPWNAWVFSISGGGHFHGEESYSRGSLRGSLSAGRITSGTKINLALSSNQNWDSFDVNGDTLESSSEQMNASGLFVKSLGEHWSVGAFLRAESSTYQNIDFSITPAPAVEFNLFPYSQSTRRQFTLLYRLGFQAVRYREETIYQKTKENLFKETLSATLKLKEKWGTVSTTLSGSHYFHDFSKNRVNLFTILSLRLVKGLNFTVFGGGSRIHDQLSLPRGEAGLEEILLRRQQLETSYDYFFSIGFSYTFGSIFTNVVNPRFGSSGPGGVSIFIH